MEARVSKLKAAMEHVPADLSDIKATLRIHDAKFDSLRDRMDGVRDHMERDFRVLFGALIAVTPWPGGFDGQGLPLAVSRCGRPVACRLGVRPLSSGPLRQQGAVVTLHRQG